MNSQDCSQALTEEIDKMDRQIHKIQMSIKIVFIVVVSLAMAVILKVLMS